MTDVFISYAHEDHGYVTRMAPALEAEGLTVWWDHTIPPGKTWDEVIAKGIADARCCIVLWSKSSVVSDWVKEEATIAKDHRKFIPVQIDNSEPPVGFRRIQAAHLQNWTGNVNDPQWQMLVREIRGVVSASVSSGAPSAPARSPGGYTPRNYAPPPAPGPSSGGGPPPLAIAAMVVAGLVAVAAVLVSVWPEPERTVAERPAVAVETPAPQPQGPDPEVERLRGERDAALRAAEAERLARERDAALARQAEERRLRAAAAAHPLDRWVGEWRSVSGGCLVNHVRRDGDRLEIWNQNSSFGFYTLTGPNTVSGRHLDSVFTFELRGERLTWRGFDGVTCDFVRAR